MPLLKAALFDDEYIVLEALKVLIPWEELGIRLVGTASDGRSALALCEQEQPDIVLTDIRMPGLNGLQLIERLKETAEGTCFIVFSGFNEFDYVKRALQLSVVDYVEKPITEAAVVRSLQKAKKAIEERERLNELSRQWEVGRSDRIEKAVWNLLQFGDGARLDERSRLALEELKLTGITVAAAATDFKLPNRNREQIVYVRNGEERYAVIFHTCSSMYMTGKELSEEAAALGVPLGFSRIGASVSDAPLCRTEALRALRAAMLHKEKGPVWSDSYDLAKGANEMLQHKESILLSLQAGNKSLMMEKVRAFIQCIQEHRVDPDVVECEMLRLIYSSQELMKDVRFPEKGEGDPSNALHIEMRSMTLAGRLAEWFHAQMEALADECITNEQSSMHKAIDMARRYVERNVSRDVSLQEVADHVGLNATYLSALFKEVTGENYIKYLTRYRIELAKTLLKKGMKVNEVSERVGYSTHRHFMEVFKRYVGCTAGRFKELHADPKKTGT